MGDEVHEYSSISSHLAEEKKKKKKGKKEKKEIVSKFGK
jgi:hypothetical protein